MLYQLSYSRVPERLARGSGGGKAEPWRTRGLPRRSGWRSSIRLGLDPTLRPFGRRGVGEGEIKRSRPEGRSVPRRHGNDDRRELAKRGRRAIRRSPPPVPPSARDSNVGSGSDREPGRQRDADRDRRAGDGAARGVTVLDLTSVVSGPLCTQTLGDLGAEVIKVETPQGDTSRRLGFPGKAGFAAYFAQFNRNKRSLALDLKHPAAVEVVRRLARRADVLLENYRPDVAERLGLGWQKLSAENPQADLRRDQRLRARRPVPRPARLRHGDPGAHRLHADAGRAERAAADPERRRRQVDGIHRGLCDARGALRARARRRPRPAHRGADARRVRRLHAARRARSTARSSRAAAATARPPPTSIAPGRRPTATS